MEIKIPIFKWKQVDGDGNPGTYGGTIAEADGSTITVRKIQPTREYVGDGEAAEVGFPFWTREACYTLADLQAIADDRNPRGWAPRDFCGLDDVAMGDMSPETRAVALACAALDYGEGADEGPAGWAEDVIPGRVQWYHSKRPQGWRYLADEDRDFRRMLKEG